MLRADARHPDADETAPAPAPAPAMASTSRAEPADVQQLYSVVGECLRLEPKFQPRLNLPADDTNGEVTIGARDGAAHVLRCLKVWFDLPADVLVDAVNLFDRFLTKMKVRPCHVPCITVSCMNIAIGQHAAARAAPPASERTVRVEELVSVSQSACTAGDVARMSRVIADKLSCCGDSVTALRWVRVFRQLLLAAGAELGVTLPGMLPESELVNMLEIAICDAACASARLSELALVLVYYKLEQQIAEWSAAGVEVPENVYCLFELGAQLQQYCGMCDASLACVSGRARSVLARYEARCAAPQRQRLVWRLSTRTLKVLRPTDRLTSLLPTIEEQHLIAESTPNRNRSGSESSESEETSDWPRSPVLPVYCDN